MFVLIYIREAKLGLGEGLFLFMVHDLKNM
jgi:hypothetical protein